MLRVTRGTGDLRKVGPTLPHMTIDTAGGAPVVSKETYINATYALTWPGHGATSGALRIRGRGDSSWLMWHPDWPAMPIGTYPPKKPYRLNFNTATAPLGMRASQRNWGLLADYYDTSKAKNAYAFALARRLSGLPWVAECRHVEVTLNGDYRGLYLLTDLARVEAGRVAAPAASGSSGLSMTGTHLVELTISAPDPDPGFVTSRGTPVAYDDPDGSNPAQAAYIQSWFEEFEDRLYGPSWLDPAAGYAPLIGARSFADWYWVNELVAQKDAANPKSVKMYKARDTPQEAGRLYFSTPWDHDLSFGADWPDAYPVERTRPPEGWMLRDQAFWFPRLMEDPAFAALVRERWEAVHSAILDLGGIAGWFDRFYFRDVGAAILRDRERWADEDGGVLTPGEITLGGERDYMVEWLSARVAWIDANV